MKTRCYILDAFLRPVHEPDFLKWAQWMEDNRALHMHHTKIDDREISTVFLGIDLSLPADASQLWETSTFGTDVPYCQRDKSYEAAMATHHRLLSEILEHKENGR